MRNHLTSNTHTPGPWVLDKDFSQKSEFYHQIEAGNVGDRQTPWFSISGILNLHDATLITAAPDLLGACKLMLHRIQQQCEATPDGKYPDNLPVEIWSCATVLNAAIRKATYKPENPKP